MGHASYVSALVNRTLCDAKARRVVELLELEFAGLSFTRTAFSGGQTKLHGAPYFRFFIWQMLATAIIFIPFAVLYKPKTFLQS